MSKKLLMNNYSENDEIILCENYSPNSVPVYLWKDREIDLDNYELYIDLNIDGNTFSNWTSALVISSVDDITSWNAVGYNGKIHVYYKKDMIRFQPVSRLGNQEISKSLLLYNNKKIQIIINKNGIYLENKLIMHLGYRILKDSIDYIKTSKTTIIGIRDLGCAYNKISLRRYQERD